MWWQLSNLISSSILLGLPAVISLHLLGISIQMSHRQGRLNNQTNSSLLCPSSVKHITSQSVLQAQSTGTIQASALFNSYIMVASLPCWKIFIGFLLSLRWLEKFFLSLKPFSCLFLQPCFLPVLPYASEECHEQRNLSLATPYIWLWIQWRHMVSFVMVLSPVSSPVCDTTQWILVDQTNYTV